MAICKPTLPPKSGYVEVEVDGVRKYRNLTTGHILGEEPEPEAEPTTEELVNLMLGVNRYE